MPDPVKTLRDFLRENRSRVLGRWRELILGSYSEDAARFFRDERDRFHNPVGHSIERATAAIYSGVCLDQDPQGVAEGLETLVRLRAVQELTPSQAVSFTFVLKRAVREALTQAGAAERHGAELVELEARLDALASSAFDTYVECRERIFNMRQDELKRRIATFLRRFGDLESENSPMADEQADAHLKGGCEA